ncbi:MAG: hypothetical protein D6710_08235 [Nitrospirae bacterium]|nr:MAG: hypothetical protein D6710_08235 [Nitrospirota bacterium]
MALFDFFKRRSREDIVDNIQKQLSDIRLALGQRENRKIEQSIKSERRALERPLHYSTRPVGFGVRSSGRDYEGPVYDLSEIAKIIDVEPYVNQSVRKHREQILKEGFTIQGPDQRQVDYIYQRFFEMELIADMPIEYVIREFTTNLVAYATSFIVKKRDSKRSSGNPVRMYGKTLEPIAAIFPMDPTSVTVKLNSNGYPVKWKQEINDTSGSTTVKVFDNDDVIVATIDKKSGFVFGTPYILPTIDDIRALRKLEELAEIIAHKYANPHLHAQVGSDEYPVQKFDDGSTEIDLVKQELENMPDTGGLVTSHRVKIDPIGLGKDAIDLVPYIKYFEERVLGGLRLSPVDLGRGDISKASAQSVSQSLQDSSKDFQAVIETAINSKLILPLLLEGGFDVTPQNRARFVFSTINREEDRARQQHGVDMFNNGVITLTEFRNEYLSKRPLSEEEMKLTKPEMAHKHAVELAKLKGGPVATGERDARNAAARRVASKTRPENQAGKKPTKTLITANSEEALASIEENWADCIECVKSFIEKHGTGKASSGDMFDVTTKDQELDSILESFITFSMPIVRELCDKHMQDGISDAMEQLGIEGQYRIAKKYVDRFYKNSTLKALRAITGGIKTLIYNDDTIAGIDTRLTPNQAVAAIFDSQLPELRRAIEKQKQLAYRFGFARTLRSHGESTMTFTPVDENVCEKCAERGEYTISLVDKQVPYNVLLATHEDCEFTVSVSQKTSVGKN